MSWEDHSQRNLRSSERERDQSARLRGQMSQLLSQCSQDMREQADRVEDAIARRVAETEEASRNLEIQLKEVISAMSIPYKIGALFPIVRFATDMSWQQS